MRIVNTEDLAKFLLISEATTRTLAKHGVIPVLRVGHVMRFDLDDVIERLKTCPITERLGEQTESKPKPEQQD